LKDELENIANLTLLDFYNSESWKSSVLEYFEGNYSIYLDFIEDREINIADTVPFKNWLETAKNFETVKFCNSKINELKNKSNNRKQKKQVIPTSFDSKLSIP